MGKFSFPRQVVRLIGGAFALVAACGAADAFTVSDSLPGLNSNQPTAAVYQPAVDAVKVDHVWWCRWGCGGWGYRGWGYRPWGWGPFAAGAVVGTAVGAAAYNGCWRRVWGPYGWQWARVC